MSDWATASEDGGDLLATVRNITHIASLMGPSASDYRGEHPYAGTHPTWQLTHGAAL